MPDLSVGRRKCEFPQVHHSQRTKKIQNTAFSLKTAAVVVRSCTLSISLSNRKMIKGRGFHTAIIIQI